MVFQRWCAKSSGYIDPGTVLADVPVRSIPDMKITTLSNALDGRPGAIHLFGTWCGACMNEWSDLPRFQQKYGDRMPLILLGIDNARALRNLVRVRPVSIPVYMGGTEAERVIAPPAYPYTVFLSPDLTVLYDKRGPITHGSYARALDQWELYQKDPKVFRHPSLGEEKTKKMKTY
jgi:thiol-disulfide isomerase/thioredoxin